MAKIDKPEYDDFFLHSRREAGIILLTWAVLFIWVIGYTSRRAYQLDPDSLETVWGMPSWMFWGVGLPWLLATLFTLWFSFGYMRDGELESVAGEEEIQKTP